MPGDNQDKQDLRVQKTRRALSTALMHLLSRTGFSKITVNDICTEALVSRSAFYAHFEDKYALLMFTIEQIKEHLFVEPHPESMELRLKGVLSGVAEHVRIIKNLSLDQVDAELIGMMRAAFHRDFERIIKERGIDPAALPGPLDVVTTYYSSGLTNAILYWVERDMPYTVDEMAACLSGVLLGPFARDGQN